MSQENVERVRTVLEDYISRKGEFDAEGMLTKLPDEEFLDPEIEWDASEVPVLDISGVYRGIEAVRQYWREWYAAWEVLDYGFRLVDAGDRVVALFDHQRMRGRSTGIEVPVVNYATVMTMRDGLCVYWKLYMSQSEALEAVGLSEQAMSQEKLEIVRSWYEPDRFADAEWIDYMYEHAWDPNIDWRAIEGAPDDIGPILGRDAMRAYYEDWQATFDEITLEAEEVIDAADDTAVAVIRVAGRAKLSGVRAELRHAVVFTLRDGKVIRGREYATRAEALEAVDLSE